MSQSRRIKIKFDSYKILKICVDERTDIDYVNVWLYDYSCRT